MSNNNFNALAVNNPAQPKCKIWMFFGDKFINGQLKIYKTDDKNSFEIEDYDCGELTTALGIQFQGANPNSFTLTETELLATGTYETWISYCVQKNDDVKNTLGYKSFEAIYGANALEELIGAAADAFRAVGAEGQTAPIAGPAFRKWQGEDYLDHMAKMQTIFDYIRKIYDTFYGKQFLVQVGDQNTGICIKDKFGNPPNGSVKVEGEGGIFYTSDVPTGDGGWPKKGSTNVLGLEIPRETEIFATDDNRIGCFVKVGKIKDIKKKIKKNGQEYSWDIDFGSFSEDSYYVKRDNFVEVGDGNSDFYCRGNVTGTIFAIEGEGQFAHFEVEPIRLKLGKEGLDCDSALTYPGAMALLTIFAGDGGNNVPIGKTKDMFCLKEGDAANKQGRHLARDQVNVLSTKNVSTFPEAVVIPFRSNLFVYGPWTFVANPIGGTQVEQNLSLVPWNFAGQNPGEDGWNLMRTFGQMVAQDGPRGLQQQEEGSITAACLPNFNLGHMIGGNAAILSDMVISIGEGGAQTTYNFQTYSPKFGQPGRHLAETWKSNYKRFLYLNKYFKEERLKVVNLANQARKNRKSTGAGIPPVDQNMDVGPVRPEHEASPVFLLMSAYFFKDLQDNSDGGELVPSGDGEETQCDPCGKPDKEKDPSATPAPSGAPNSVDEQVFSCIYNHRQWEFARPYGYKELTITSLDAIFTPMSLKGNDSGNYRNTIPRFAMYPSLDAVDPNGGTTGDEYKEFSETSMKSEPGFPPRSRPRNEIPPFVFESENDPAYDLPIHQTYLNAYTSKKILDDWDDRKNGSSKGFVIYAITYGDDYKKLAFGKICDSATDASIGGTGTDQERKQLEDNFRFSALKGPLVLQAWGYDTSGKPIPNEVDSAKEAENGKFRISGLKDKFMRDWLSNAKTWPAGPIDLRFDRNRGVWVAPPSNKIVVARLTENLSKYGVATAELINPEAGGVRFYENYGIWGPDGENIKKSLKTTKIKVYDYLGVSLCACDIIYAYYDDGRYIVLESSRTYDPNVTCIQCTTETPSEPTPSPTASHSPTQSETASRGSETPSEPTPTQKPSPPSPPTPPIPTSNCWCDLECLKTIDNFKANKHQALVHKVVTGGEDCLAWEDIVECYPTPGPISREDPE